MSFQNNDQEDVPPPSDNNNNNQVQNFELDDLQKVQVRNLYEKFKKMNSAHNRFALHFHWLPPQKTDDDGPISSYSGPLPGDDRYGSKLGGLPFWSADTLKYPYKRTSDDPDDENNFGKLLLLAQFNLSEIPLHLPEVSDLAETLLKLNLPTDGGILQFYVCPGPTYGLYDCQSAGQYQAPDCFRVKYWPKSVVEETTDLLDAKHFPEIKFAKMVPGVEYTCDELLPIEPAYPLKIIYGKKPQQQQSQQNHSGLIEEFWGFSDRKAREKFNDLLRQELPEIVSFLCQPDPEKDAWKICDALNFIQEELGYTDPASGSKLGGHPYFTQDDPRSGWGNNCQDLVFQLDSDKEVCIGDCGVMGFFGARGMTSKGEFGGLKYNWDCG
jgi:uncharacterized protein YwqG